MRFSFDYRSVFASMSIYLFLQVEFNSSGIVKFTSPLLLIHFTNIIQCLKRRVCSWLEQIVHVKVMKCFCFDVNFIFTNDAEPFAVVVCALLRALHSRNVALVLSFCNRSQTFSLQKISSSSCPLRESELAETLN